ncbi:MAG: GNAT family N-acetyltransferase [Chloroflexota bacterium]
MLEQMFADLHASNASYDPSFALLPGWRQMFRADLARMARDGSGSALIAWVGDTPAGLAVVRVHDEPGPFVHRQWVELSALYVTPRARRLGVGRTLLEAAEAWSRVHGYACVQLFVTRANDAARAFYRSAGFAPIQEVWRSNLRPEGPKSIPLDKENN